MCCHVLRENIMVARSLSNLCFSFSSLIFFRFVLFLKSLHSSAGYCHFLYITSSTSLCHWTLGIDSVVTSVLCVRSCLNASVSPFPLLPPALPVIPHYSHQSLLHTCVYSCAQTESPSTVTFVYVLRADHWALDKQLVCFSLGSTSLLLPAFLSCLRFFV